MLKTLQAGRALAAIGVVAFHLSMLLGLERYGGQAYLGTYTKFGKLGVDFFFILSGFIILFAHVRDINNPQAWGHYTFRRFVRLFPVYWIYTALFVVFALFGIGSDAAIPSTMAGWISSLTLIRFNGVTPPLIVAWTLFYELFFYFVFSILIYNLYAGIAAFVIFIGSALIFYQFPTETNQTPFATYTAAYNLYFVFGMAAFLLYRRSGAGIIELIAGFSITTAGIVTMPLSNGLSPIVFALGFALLLVAATKLERTGYLIIPEMLAFIGDASYTIYLVHFPVIGVLLKVTIKVHLMGMLGISISYFMILIATICISCLIYYYVERPLLKLVRRRRKF